METIVLESENSRAPSWSPLAEMRDERDAEVVAEALVSNTLDAKMRPHVVALLSAALAWGWQGSETTTGLYRYLLDEQALDGDAKSLPMAAACARNVITTFRCFGGDGDKNSWSLREWLDQADRPQIKITEDEVASLFHRLMDMHLGVCVGQVVDESEEVPA